MLAEKVVFVFRFGRSKSHFPAPEYGHFWHTLAHTLFQVVFEPNPKENSKTTSRVATCGGNAICIIDVNSGKILMEYQHEDVEENFNTLAWATLTLDDEKTNILASGGMRGEIRMFHPQNKVA